MKWLCVIFSSVVLASPTKNSIPRSPLDYLSDESVFEGGKSLSANLENIRFSPHPETQSERWVLDFSDTDSKEIGKLAPRFQLRYVKSAPHNKFILELFSIRRNKIQISEIKKLVQKSEWIENIVIYPPIAEGEVALEFILKKPVSFKAHQPLENEGRLVLDLKSAESKHNVKERPWTKTKR